MAATKWETEQENAIHSNSDDENDDDNDDGSTIYKNIKTINISW